METFNHYQDAKRSKKTYQDTTKPSSTTNEEKRNSTQETNPGEAQENQERKIGSITNTGQKSDSPTGPLCINLDDSVKIPDFLTHVPARKNMTLFVKEAPPKQCPSGENCSLPMMTHFENDKIDQLVSRERSIFCNGSVHRLSARIHDLSSYKNGVGGIIEAQQYLTPTSLHPGISLLLW